MVALADWYILPILLQLGKLSGPQDALSRYSQCPKLFTEYFKLLVQPNSMAWSMLLPSANDQLNSTKSLGGSSIFRPMIKFHAVGQDKYTGFLYYGIQTSSYLCGIFKEILGNWSSYAEFIFLVHMVPPVWWAASSWCCDPISYAAMRELDQGTRTTLRSTWDQWCDNRLDYSRPRTFLLSGDGILPRVTYHLRLTNFAFFLFLSDKDTAILKCLPARTQTPWEVKTGNQQDSSSLS